MNGDGKVTPSDDTVFKAQCVPLLPSNSLCNAENKKCDFNDDNHLNTADQNSYNAACLTTNKFPPSCDLNEDNELNIADVNRLFAHCQDDIILAPGGGVYDAKCDLNRDGEIDVSDINVFISSCFPYILLGRDTIYKKCDFDGNGTVDESDFNKLRDAVMDVENLPTELYPIYDLNENGQVQIDDITKFNNICRPLYS